MPIDYIEHNKAHLTERLPQQSYEERYQVNKLHTQSRLINPKQPPTELVNEVDLQRAIDKYLGHDSIENENSTLSSSPSVNISASKQKPIQSHNNDESTARKTWANRSRSLQAITTSSKVNTAQSRRKKPQRLLKMREKFPSADARLQKHS